jgi:hypothetical protein
MDDTSTNRIPSQKGRNLGVRSYFRRETTFSTSQSVIDLENEWSQKYVTGTWEAPTESSLSPVSWNLDPPSLMVNHPSRITDSNTRITIREDSLKERTTPKIRQRTGLGSNTTKIVTMGRTHTGLNHHYTRGFDHSSPSQSEMDHCTWKVEHPKSEMGTNTGNTTTNL